MADFIPDNQFKPDSAATQVAAPDGSADFIPDSNFISDEQKYGDTKGELKAAILGALRSASFGLSDEFLTRTGAMKPEDLKAYKEQNPNATTAGEVGGVLGAVLAPETGIARLLSAPIKAVSKLGGAIAEAATPVAESIAGRIAGAETSPVINKILSQAGSMGVGSAVEGAVYGLGQSITEHALGDPDLNAESVLANVGAGAITGGALGSLFGGIKGGVQEKFPRFLSEETVKGIAEGDHRSLIEGSDIANPEKEGILNGLTKLKSDAVEIRQAAVDLDNAPVLPGMISDSKMVQKAQDSLLNGPPTMSSLKAQQMATEGFEKASQATEKVLGADMDITKASLGDTLKGVVSESVEAQAKPINELYDQLKSEYQTLPVSDRALKQVAANIKKIEDVPLSPQARSIAEGVADRLQSIKTVDDLKRLKSIINQELGFSATPIQKRVTAIIGDKLATLEENSIVRFAQNEMKTSAAKDRILRLLDEREAVNAQYSVFRDKIERLGEAMGRKRVHGAQDFLDHIESMTPEKIADKLAAKNNSKFLDWFSAEFPQGMESISQYQKGLIRNAAMKDGEFNIRRAMSEIDKMPHEYKQKIFTAEELKKLDSVKKYTQAFPKNFNPSGTSNADTFRHFFGGPLGAAVSNIRDFAIEGFIRGATSGEQTKSFIAGLTKIEKTAAKTAKSVNLGVNAIFSQERNSSGKGYVAVSAIDRREQHNKNQPEISQYSQDPQKLIDKLHADTENMAQIAPKTAQAAQQTMARAVQFLNSKLPGAGIPQKPLSAQYRPSDTELAKWHKYFSAVDSPTQILNSVARGTIVPEEVEAVSAVYPKLMHQMQVAVTDKMTTNIAKNKSLPYKTKMALSMFLGTDLVDSLNPVSILATQNMMTTATQAKMQQEQMSVVNKKNVGKIEKSNSFLTPMQRSAQRMDA